MSPPTTPTPRGSSLFSRMVPGGRFLAMVAAAACAVGLYFGNKLGNFGVGQRGDTGTGSGEAVVSTDTVPSTPRPNKPNEAGKPGKGSTLDVVIDGEGYALKPGVSPEELVPISLKAVLDLVKDYPGGNDGVRVRIFRKGSALPKAEQALQDGLRDAGVPNSSVLLTEGIID